MAKYNTATLVAAIKLAAQAARQADPGPGLHNDGGTCNFDAAFVCVPGIRKTQVEEITKLLASADIRVWLNNHSLYGRILLLSCYEGQANRRTTMAEASGKSLKASGVECGMYYQMD